VPDIKFDKDGFVYLPIHIRCNLKPDMKLFDYKIDTGANRTTISREWLYRLGYDDNWIKSGMKLTGNDRPTVATGDPIDDCYIIAVPEINIGGCVGYNWPFLTSLSAKFKFLMGTDTMRFFNWDLDYENGICRYNLIPGKRELLFNQAVQSIHSMDEVK